MLIEFMQAVLVLLFLMSGVGRRDADRLLASGDYQSAANAYLQLLEVNPNDPALLEGAGRSFLALNRPDRAIPFLQRELTISPQNLAAARQLAAAFVEVNQFGIARDLLTWLTERDPSDAVSWYRLGLLMYKNGYYGAAIKELNSAIAGLLSGPEAGPYRNRAEVIRAIAFVEAGLSDAAGKTLPGLLARTENAADLDLRLSYVRLLYESGRYDEAMRQTEAALAVKSTNAAVHFWRARILHQQQQIPQAVAEGEIARGLSPESPAPRNLLVRLYRKLGRMEDAARETEWLRVHEAAAGEPRP